MNKALFFISIIFITSLTACSTFTPHRYNISADNNIALKSIGASNINVGVFKNLETEFDNNCRAAGPILPPDGLSFEEYIKNALEDELKIAGMFNDISPTVTLTGAIEKLSFSSSRGLTGGYWNIGLRVTSSNGKSVYVTERYEFNSGFDALTACKQTAEAYCFAVQNLIGKLIKSPDFKGLVTP